MLLIRLNPAKAVFAPQHCGVPEHPEFSTVLAHPFMFSGWDGHQGGGNSCKTAKQIDPVWSSPDGRTDTLLFFALPQAQNAQTKEHAPLPMLNQLVLRKKNSIQRDMSLQFALQSRGAP